MKDYITNYKKEIIIYIICAVLTAIMITPILIVGFHNYPSGDDYWFGIYTYQGFKQSGIIGAIMGSFRMVAEIYEIWQGTWFTIFLFTLSPQNFVANGYAIVVFISVIGLAIAEFVILKRYLCNEYGFSKITFVSLFFVIFNLSLQYMPRTTSGIFWFNGIMHYTIPFIIAMGCISASRLVLQTDANEKYTGKTIMIILGLFALGGSNYLAAIIGLMGVGYELFISFCNGLKKRRIGIMRCLTFIIAIILEFAGLYVSYKSPGNNIRANDDMSFRPTYFLKCIWWSIDRCRIKAAEMFVERPILWLYLVGVIMIVSVELYTRYKKNNYSKLVNYSLIAVLFVNGIQAISYLPEVYADSDVSGGVPNTHYWMMLLIILADVIIIEDVIFAFMSKHFSVKTTSKICDAKLVLLAISLLLVLSTSIYIFNSPQTTTDGYCEEYISSGRMQEYEQVWWEQYKIYTDASIQEAVVPEYYDDVYPTLHMCLDADSTNGHNINRTRYYNKKSVIAYDYKEENISQ